MEPTAEELQALVTYCADAVSDGYPFQVKGRDAEIVLALLAAAIEKRADQVGEGR